MSYYAHTADGLDGKPAGVDQWQSLKDHLRGVADRAWNFAFRPGWRCCREKFSAWRSSGRGCPRCGRINQGDKNSELS